MATYTGNLSLKKPDQSDKIRIADFNGNSDAIDAAIGAAFGVGSNPSIDDAVNSMGEGLAIISNGNTHAAITSGKYVYVRGHGTLAEGLYVATASIAQNGTLSLNNVSAVSGGGLNAVIATQTATVTVPSGVTNLFFACRKSGNIVTLNGGLSLSNAIAGTNALVATLPTGFRPSSARNIMAYTTYGVTNGMYHFTVKTDGSVVTDVGSNTVSGSILFSCAFCI